MGLETQLAEDTTWIIGEYRHAKHHAAIIAGSADDRSAMAVARRERFQELYDGLAKLGVRLVRPDGLRPAA